MRGGAVSRPLNTLHKTRRGSVLVLLVGGSVLAASSGLACHQPVERAYAEENERRHAVLRVAVMNSGRQHVGLRATSGLQFLAPPSLRDWPKYINVAKAELT
ncbi:hypothetical protein MRX96_043658 [Rhipicephalus microplus]